MKIFFYITFISIEGSKREPKYLEVTEILPSSAPDPAKLPPVGLCSSEARPHARARL